MITIQHLNEVFQIINGEHADPHRILGMHEVEEKGNHFLVVRAFIPADCSEGSVWLMRASQNPVSSNRFHNNRDGYD